MNTRGYKEMEILLQRKCDNFFSSQSFSDRQSQQSVAAPKKWKSHYKENATTEPAASSQSARFLFIWSYEYSFEFLHLTSFVAKRHA